jgi:hypothetical protein
MKKAFTLLVATLLTLSSFAQLDKAYMIQVARYNKTIGDWKWDEPENVNLRFTIETNYIKIHDEYGTKLWTYEDLGEKSGYDDDGDSYKKHVWLAYDEKNRKCRFTMLWYTSGVKLVTYTIQYSDIAFRYYISTNNNDL